MSTLRAVLERLKRTPKIEGAAAAAEPGEVEGAATATGQVQPPAVQTLDDVYLTWLSFSNAGMLHPGNTWLMQQAIQALPPQGAVIEIGSFCGLSANVLSYLLRANEKGNPMYSCDRWEFEGATGDGTIGNGITHSAYREFVKSSFMRNVEFFGGDRKPHTIEVFSDEFFDLWRAGKAAKDVFGEEVVLGGPIALCYVDGNHTYEFAKRDFCHVDEFLLQDGFILFDDSFDANPFGLTPLMQEIERDPRYRVVARNPNYLFQKTPSGCSDSAGSASSSSTISRAEEAIDR